jgi:hypothetical protein
MQPTQQSIHSFYLEVDQYYYLDPTDYNCTPELINIVKKNANKETSILRSNIWANVTFHDSAIPTQGWKIHISANIVNYQKILDLVSECP